VEEDTEGLEEASRAVQRSKTAEAQISNPTAQEDLEKRNSLSPRLL